MKKYTLYFICLLLAVATISCKKEKEEDSFLKGQMTEFHGQKAYIDGSNYSCFRVKETIRVNNRPCTVSAVTNNDRTCTISGAEENNNGYYAFYPANLISATDLSGGFGSATVTLPRVQQYFEENSHQVIDNPMAGHLAAPSGTIEFNNLCALLKVTVASNWTLDSIQVKLNGAELWGRCTVDVTNWKLDLNNGEHDTKYETVSLVFPNGMNLSSSLPNGKTFYIVVPQTTIFTDANKNDVIVQIFGRYKTATVSKSYSKELTADQSVAYNTINTLPTINYQENIGIGVFTVAPGKQVTFSQRQLIIHNNNYLVDGYSYGGISSSDRHFFTNGDYINTLIPGYAAHTWRTPTKDEWDYVLNDRTTASGKHYVKAYIGTHRGLIIFPDDWIRSNNSGYNKLDNFDTPNAKYLDGSRIVIQITENEWKNYFEPDGCVFLRGFGTGNTNGSGDPGTQGNDLDGYYATATSGKILIFNNGNVTTTSIGSYKVNVRLVHDLN